MNNQAMKLGTKLGLAFFAMVLLTMVVGGFSLSRVASVNSSTEDIATNWLPSIKVLGEVRTFANQMRRVEADHVMAVDAAEMAAMEKRIDELKASLNDAMARYEPMISSDEERSLYSVFRREKEAYLTIQAKLIEVSRGGEKTADQTKAMFRGASRAAFNAMTGEVGKLVELNSKGSEASAAEAKATYQAAIVWASVLILLAVVTAAVLGFVIVRGVKRQLGGEPGDAADLAQRVADGDLSTPIHLEPGDQTSMLAALKRMQESLVTIVTDVRENADGVATASAQIAQGNLDLSSRTEEQASALQQTAASMEQLGSTVKHNAENARQASQLAGGASGVAGQGGTVVSQVVATMKEIDESSKRIADIIGVIDGIAFQTNILALNAAVEAARAGEQGRGFAVVAGEVRTLAQRSAEAAKEIKSLITASVERVGRGSEQVGEAGKKMDEIVSSIRRVTDIMGEISAASQEQSAGVTQIGEAVTQMDQVTQQNAALVEESAAAADSLQTQARRLVAAVSVFKLAGAAHTASHGLRSSAAPEPQPAKKTVVKPSVKKAEAPASGKAPAQQAAEPVKAGSEEWATF
ncbi:methyl-accepting chemotaxis protein [Piscinibacter sp. HJYY11]|uniref:methyl-accepting chemotaxis protein n=1 Tax=Piscinibacter sp. HJYY11 TaxID=2801333 RepID=UPI00287397CF|nr:methyl-accepting chemotaxis protein [Piscinibacter sp. HJYY11]